MNAAWTRLLPQFIREKIEGRHSLQKALGNTGWMLGDQVVRKVVGLLIGILVARHFGPQPRCRTTMTAYAILFSAAHLSIRTCPAQISTLFVPRGTNLS